MENITTLKEALENLSNSEEYKKLCEVVLDIKQKEIQVDNPTIERMIGQLHPPKGGCLSKNI